LSFTQGVEVLGVTLPAVGATDSVQTLPVTAVVSMASPLRAFPLKLYCVLAVKPEFVQVLSFARQPVFTDFVVLANQVPELPTPTFVKLPANSTSRLVSVTFVKAKPLGVSMSV
jgi:hypothetical protein